MNVLLVSQCSKKALVETRRVLDQFAERCGARTWQTPITQQGLDTLRVLLKSTARRNTAVACHWIRGRDHTELLWIVGNARLFNEKGSVPTNITERDVLRRQDENDWHTLQDIQTLSAIAALFHDFGKACQAFQTKLYKKKKKNYKDAYRHEWVSLRLFQSFVGEAADDQNWLSRLTQLEQDTKGAEEKACLDTLLKDGINQDRQMTDSLFKKLPPVAKAVGWLILTHHFLPQPSTKANRKSGNKGFNAKKLNKLLESIGPEWNNANPDATPKDKEACWKFDKKLPFSSTHWRARASYWGKQALKQTSLLQINWLDDLFSLHLARLSLMLADHYYSSLPAHSNLGDRGFPLFANTDKETGERKQRLDEHLVGVAKHAKGIVETLPLLERVLPRIARHKRFKQRSIDSNFRWQDEAYNLACSLRERTAVQGFFGVNMASTGCGKTLANGRIMYGLANPNRGARFCIALGLRILTLQTGEAYRERLRLGTDDLAVLVGSTAIKDLFNLETQQNEKKASAIFAACGSESAEPLLPDNTYVHYEGALTVGPLKHWLSNKRGTRELLAAPILVCTVDYLIGATEATRGGKQIAPMLRLLTSDLVLDEPDDFDVDDLPALSRLVHWAGMLGSRVLLSSATLPLALIEGLFNAYSAGRAMFQKSRGIPGQAVNICCAWFDEKGATTSDHANPASFIAAHNQFVAQRTKKLHQDEVRRRAIIKPLDINSQEPAEVRQQVAYTVNDVLHELHQQHHEVDAATGKRVSFGLVRFANIDPLIDIAQALFKQGAQADHRLLLCCYHSRFPLLLRANIEKHLDRLLNRHEDIFKDVELRNILDSSRENNIIFVVLASPVAEVGRDHDYDWAIVEPSSMRSIIQLAGRIRRHRKGVCNNPNIYLLSSNIKSLECQNGRATYCRPGFETDEHEKRFLLHSHHLAELLTSEQYETINAAPRIRARDNLMPKENLVDLEHARLQALLLGKLAADDFPVSLWWQTQAALGGALQQVTPFHRDLQGQQRFALMPDEENEQKLVFFDLEGKERKRCDELFSRIKIQMGERIAPWPQCDYLAALNELAEQLTMDIAGCARRFSYVDLPKRNDGELQWCYHPVLGLRRKDR